MVRDLFRECKQFMRHKELLASPLLLKNESIPLVKFVQVSVLSLLFSLSVSLSLLFRSETFIEQGMASRRTQMT